MPITSTTITGQARPARCPRRGRDEHRLALLVDRLDPAEVGVIGARQAARGRGRLDAVPSLEHAADDELDLGRGEDREREPERDRSLEAVGEQPEHDEAESPDAGGRLSTSPRDHPAQGRGSVGSRACSIRSSDGVSSVSPTSPTTPGLLTFAGLPTTQDPAELEGVDVAIVGAPMDDLTSDRPGTRFGPRAIRAAGCPPGPHLEAHLDAIAELRVVDFGDAPVVPADPAGNHAAIERIVGQVVAAGAIPIVLGGDHSISEPDVKAVAAVHGPVALVHFDTHTDTGEEVFGVEVSHGTPMYRLVRDGHVDGARYVQIGLRGYWPGEREFAWQAEHGITSFFMHDVRDRGIRADRRGDDRDRRRGARVPDRGRRRARSGLRAGNRDAGARRDDERRPPLGVPGDRVAARGSSGWTWSR